MALDLRSIEKQLLPELARRFIEKYGDEIMFDVYVGGSTVENSVAMMLNKLGATRRGGRSEAFIRFVSTVIESTMLAMAKDAEQQPSKPAAPAAPVK